MRKLLQVGDRVIDLAAVVAAEKGDGSLTVYLAGIDEPFRFASDEAVVVWSALVQGVSSSANAPDDPMDFQIIEMSLDDGDDAIEEAPAVTGPIYKSIDLSERAPDSQMIA
ncbi:MAG: hypothetical protein JWN40_2505 [Phycisphaerales bacterium]|nr:hypothetical protein [Phycisphaerales bacterium]